MKGLNPVVKVVFILIFAITVSIGVALWLTSITSGFTRTENLEFLIFNARGTPVEGYTINITVKNTGTSNIIITDVLIGHESFTVYNGKLIFIRNGRVVASTTSKPHFTLRPGQQVELVIKIPPGTAIPTDNRCIPVKIHTVTAKDYPVTVPCTP